MITLEQVRDAAKKLATDRVNPSASSGDRIVSSCRYTNATGEHCLAGEMFLELGIDLPEEELLNVVRVTYSEAPWRSLFEEDALFYMAALQSAADQMRPWKQCYEIAENLQRMNA